VACGSGGTAAGVALGAAAYDVAPVVHAMAVCDDVAYFQVLIERIAAEARSIEVDLPSAARVEIHDRWRGPAYGVAGPEQQRFLIDVARASGLVLDPVYSGKALFALAELQPKPSSVLFVHTGGLPGLLAQAATLAPSL
jgi:D-cysteine desulfhydrase